MQRAQDLIDFQKAYKEAVERTFKILNQESQFRDNLDRWVTTSFSPRSIACSPTPKQSASSKTSRDSGSDSRPSNKWQ